MALSDPPKSHTTMSEGRSAAWPFDDSGQGRREKKMTSTSLTMLWESIATTVGAARRRTALYGVSTLERGKTLVVVAMLERPRPCDAGPPGRAGMSPLTTAHASYPTSV
jgi:hypothetical protein